MACEDFSDASWVETDPSSDITKTVSRVSFDTMSREVNAAVGKEYTADYFGNFCHAIDIRLTSASGDSGVVAVWLLSNVGTGATYEDINVANSGYTLHFFANSGSPTLTFRSWSDDNQAVVNISAGTTYYCIIERTASAISCKVYSDAAHTTLISGGTLSVTRQSTAFRYLGVCGSRDYAGDPSTLTGYCENLDIAYAAGGLSIPVAMAAYRRMRI